MRMTGIENKKKLLTSIKQENNLGDAFQSYGADISKLFGFDIATS